MTKTVKIEVVLTDILERLRSIECKSADSDKALDARLAKMELEIEGVKKAAKMFSLVVKVGGGILAALLTLWNIFGKITGKKL